MENKTFQGKKLDKFQVEAIEAIDNNHSVVVSAATGTGKTLTADYVIDKYLKAGKKIIYTAPIKALSNQKYADFKAQYGEENVGILTGDVTINHEAPLRIMTTEIYRNMLLANDPEIEEIAYVIFDEIHFLGDIERGTVWEESIIFSKEQMRFLCLSATIPNAKQLANWISYTKGHKVEVVTEKKRAVPLEMEFYDIEYGFKTLKELKKLKKEDKRSFRKMPKQQRKKFLKDLDKQRNNTHLNLIEDLEREEKLPAIYFCFSRVMCERKASTLSSKKNLTTAKEATEIKKIVNEKLSEADEAVLDLETTKTLRHCLSKGIAFHHAGILPALKETVEVLFNKGLVKCLFATETFAVGINMPAKTVCFDSLEKYDGINFRTLYSKEFFQLAGRAGRRGIDEKGYVISILEKNMVDLEKVEEITSEDKDHLKSQFQLSFNTVLNLVHNHTEDEQNTILQSNFYAYQQTGRRSAYRVINSFEKKKKKLKKNGFIAEGHTGEELTEKGLFGMKIYTEELLVSEVFCSYITPHLTDFEMLLIAGRIVYEEKKNTKFETKYRDASNEIMNKIRNNKYLYNHFRKNPLFILETFLKEWYEGCDFLELMEYTNMPEGDIVRYIRQVIDLLQQIQHATLNDDLRDRIKNIKEGIDRDVISVRF